MTTHTNAPLAAADSQATSAAPASIVVQRRIEWPDTDASGRWHNTAAFRFVEVAETALLERLGLLHDVYGRLPRVRIEADFKKLLAFRDLVDISIEVTAVGNSSLTYDFEILKGGEVCVKAKVVAVLLHDDGHPARWSQRQRDILLGAGPQTPELLVRAEERP